MLCKYLLPLSYFILSIRCVYYWAFPWFSSSCLHTHFPFRDLHQCENLYPLPTNNRLCILSLPFCIIVVLHCLHVMCCQNRNLFMWTRQLNIPTGLRLVLVPNRSSHINRDLKFVLKFEITYGFCLPLRIRLRTSPFVLVCVLRHLCWFPYFIHGFSLYLYIVIAII